MTTAHIITLIVVIAACVGAIILLYFMGKRNMKKRDEQQAAIDQAAQWVNMLIIDKKKLRMKESGLPQQVIDQTTAFCKTWPSPGLSKAKVGPQIVTLIADNQIYDQIPVKKEVKASLSGLFISDVRGVRGPLEKPEKKRGFFAKLTGQK